MAADPDVRAYGAVGDGSRDDTAAIQAAIDNGLALIPFGAFKVSGLTITRPDVLVRGYGFGSRLVLADGADDHAIYISHQGARSRLEDFAVDGNKAGQTATSSGVRLAAEANTVPLDDVQLRRLTIFDTQYAGIYINGGPGNLPVSGTLIEGCTLYGTDWHAILASWTAPNTRILNNHIKNTTSDDADGIRVGNGSDDCIISNNLIENTGDHSIEIQYAARATVVGNRIRNSGGFSIDIAAGCDNSVVTGNLVTDGPNAAGLAVEMARNVAVTGNTVKGCRRPVSLHDSDVSASITGNTFQDCEKALKLSPDTVAAVITGNLFDNVGAPVFDDRTGGGPTIVFAHNTILEGSN